MINPTSPSIDLSNINGLVTKVISGMTLAELRIALYSASLTRAKSPWEALTASQATFDWVVTGRLIDTDEPDLENMKPEGNA